MAKILQFEKEESKAVTYFCKAVIDSLCEGSEDSGLCSIEIVDISGNTHEVYGAHIDLEENKITLEIED